MAENFALLSAQANTTVFGNKSVLKAQSFPRAEITEHSSCNAGGLNCSCFAARFLVPKIAPFVDHH
jgi:hypothetical protein